ncbi:MAG: sigma 54-interacting transcriptional regulator [bacterium]
MAWRRFGARIESVSSTTRAQDAAVAHARATRPMEIPALLYRSNAPLEPVLVPIAPLGIADWAPDAPAEVFVVPAEQLPALLNHPKRFVERSAKRGAKELARYLLLEREARIPVVEAAYANAGAFKRSIQAFLTRAAAFARAHPHRRRALFVVGVSSTLFAELTSTARPAVVSALAPREHSSSGTLGARLLNVMVATRRQDEALVDSLGDELIGSSADHELVRRMIALAARSRDPVLITGESGTGKDRIARLIHDAGPRHRKGSFIAVNCAAIPAEQVGEELFGDRNHTEGAAQSGVRASFFALARHGTIFLDEIDELPLAHQARLRQLVDGAGAERGDSRRADEADARLIAASRADLAALAARGAFRTDLFHRLRALPIRAPSLRDDPPSIPPLARHFWKHLGGTPELPEPLLTELERYAWPGNARELKLVLTQLHGVFGSRTELGVEHLRAVTQMLGLTPLAPTAAVALPSASDWLTGTRLLRDLDDVLRACALALRLIEDQRIRARTSDGNPLAALGTYQRSLRTRASELASFWSNGSANRAGSGVSMVFDQLVPVEQSLAAAQALAPTAPAATVRTHAKRTRQAIERCQVTLVRALQSLMRAG